MQQLLLDRVLLSEQIIQQFNVTSEQLPWTNLTTNRHPITGSLALLYVANAFTCRLFLPQYSLTFSP
jgi:hypothetical protein